MLEGNARGVILLGVIVDDLVGQTLGGQFGNVVNRQRTNINGVLVVVGVLRAVGSFVYLGPVCSSGKCRHNVFLWFLGVCEAPLYRTI